MQNYREKLGEITTFIFDFDGVLSDGKIYVMGDGEQVRATNTKDGYALQYALRKGYRVAIISGGSAESMKERYKNFSGMDIFLGVSNKVEVFNRYATAKGIKFNEVLYMGDDIPDYKLMLLAGVKCCPADACEEVKSIADYISYQVGGNGAVRDVIEQTLKAQGRWFEEDACIW
ncbi:MAG: HAD hydrolase family protein [Bacteroidales bacterium]|jgi:3-deoxy-D-manno-octulosonate 8-phosphate phosphatase (KDO 8-P phosphatase)|nr:HAD hydrolase family protein [Bacteroidales bacterium]